MVSDYAIVQRKAKQKERNLGIDFPPPPLTWYHPINLLGFFRRGAIMELNKTELLVGMAELRVRPLLMLLCKSSLPSVAVAGSALAAISRGDLAGNADVHCAKDSGLIHG